MSLFNNKIYTYLFILCVFSTIVPQVEKLLKYAICAIVYCDVVYV